MRSLAILLSASMLALSPTVVTARLIPNWYFSYAELFDKSEVVAIVAVSSVRDVENTDGFEQDYAIQRLAVLEVDVVMKGEHEDELELVCFRSKPYDSEKGLQGVVVNGPSYLHLTTEGDVVREKVEPDGTRTVTRGEPPRYLIFLRKREDGRYEPVTGHLDPQYSVKVVTKVSVGR